MPSQRKGLLNHLMLDCLVERTGFIRQDKHTSTSGFCFGCIAGEEAKKCDWGLKRVRWGNQLFISNVWERLKYLFVQRIKRNQKCLWAFVPTFSWKTKQDSRAVACSTVRSLKRPLKIISVSRSSSPLETFTQTLIKCFLFVILSDRNLDISSLFGRGVGGNKDRWMKMFPHVSAQSGLTTTQKQCPEISRNHDHVTQDNPQMLL